MNRCAVSVVPRQPLLDWALGLGLELPGAAAREAGLYLLPSYATDAEAEALLRRAHAVIFETELSVWCPVQRLWPQDRSYGVFRRWFEPRFHPLVQDLVAGGRPTVLSPRAALLAGAAGLAPVADDDALPERTGMPLPLQILAGVGALSFLLIGLNSLLLPPVAPPSSPPPPQAGQAT
ncbi:hypothetical protein KBY97_14105 [Synechococcus sp. ATX 2A4]|nr:hypothetical protein [Synechococcus sp. ATX 2A4]